MSSGRWIGKRWHDFDGGDVKWIMMANERINDAEKEGYLQAQEPGLERTEDRSELR